MTELSEEPDALLTLVWRCSLIRCRHELDRSLEVSEQFPEVRRTGERGDISRTEIEHPLACFFGFFVVAQLDMGVGEKSIHLDIIRNLFVEGARQLQCLRKLVLAQQHPDAH